MNKQDDLESRLRSYLAEGAGKDPSWDLERRIAARVLHGKREWMLQLAAAAAIVVLAIGLGIGLSKIRQLSRVSATPTATPLVSPSASAKPTPVPTGAEGRNTYPLLAPSNFKMINQSTGWASGSGTDRILRTHDGGTHWDDVTPATARTGTWTTFFLDGNRAWLASSLQPGASTADFTVLIYRTSDAGGSWQQVGTVPADWGWPAAIDFVDAQHGWLLTKQDGTLQTPGSDLVALYGTGDGGATWRKLTQSDPGAAAGTLPLACSKADLVFLDAITGWITGGCGVGGGPFLYVTHDGGGSWAAVTPPLPAQASACDCSVDGIRFLDHAHGAFVLDGAYQDAGGYAQNLLYVTGDAGRSWRLAAVMPQNAYSVYFLNPSYGWTVDAKTDVLLVTSDGGHHWVAKGTIPATPSVVTVFQPVDTGHGWALGWTTTGMETIVVTTDGGFTWTSQLSA